MTTLAGTGKGTRAAEAGEDVTDRVPFLLLGLELPPAPLFKDVMEKNIIPQVHKEGGGGGSGGGGGGGWWGQPFMVNGVCTGG